MSQINKLQKPARVQIPPSAPSDTTKTSGAPDARDQKRDQNERTPREVVEAEADRQSALRGAVVILARCIVADVEPLPAGVCVVVVVTDADGEFVGVASTAESRDRTYAILRCALDGEGLVEHPIAGAE